MQKRVDNTDTDNKDEFQDRITEDDILHEQILEDFGGNLSQEEAETLYTYLTTPYMRIPLVLQFLPMIVLVHYLTLAFKNCLKNVCFLRACGAKIFHHRLLK